MHFHCLYALGFVSSFSRAIDTCFATKFSTFMIMQWIHYHVKHGEKEKEIRKRKEKIKSRVRGKTD